MADDNVEAFVIDSPDILYGQQSLEYEAYLFKTEDASDDDIDVIFYVMRAFDSSINSHVHWRSRIIDRNGINYKGEGPINDVIVSNIIWSCPPKDSNNG